MRLHRHRYCPVLPGNSRFSLVISLTALWSPDIPEAFSATWHFTSWSLCHLYAFSSLGVSYPFYSISNPWSDQRCFLFSCLLPNGRDGIVQLHSEQRTYKLCRPGSVLAMSFCPTEPMPFSTPSSQSKTAPLLFGGPFGLHSRSHMLDFCGTRNHVHSFNLQILFSSNFSLTTSVLVSPNLKKNYSTEHLFLNLPWSLSYHFVSLLFFNRQTCWKITNSESAISRLWSDALVPAIWLPPTQTSHRLTFAKDILLPQPVSLFNHITCVSLALGFLSCPLRCYVPQGFHLGFSFSLHTLLMENLIILFFQLSHQCFF